MEVYLQAQREIREQSGKAYDAYKAGLNNYVGKLGRPETPYDKDKT